VKHRGIDYGVQEDRPGIGAGSYPKTEDAPKVVGDAKHLTRERAVEACIEEINNGLEDGHMARSPDGAQHLQMHRSRHYDCPEGCQHHKLRRRSRSVTVD
jgi:hypothetical protein